MGLCELESLGKPLSYEVSEYARGSGPTEPCGPVRELLRYRSKIGPRAPKRRATLHLVRVGADDVKGICQAWQTADRSRSQLPCHKLRDEIANDLSGKKN
jgi:hypothetical protein